MKLNFIFKAINYFPCLLLCLLAGGFAGCGVEEAPAPEARHQVSAFPVSVKSPANNTPSDAKVELGRLLFYDPILSGDRDVACATCHHPNNGYAEFRDLSIGVKGVGFASKRKFHQPNAIPIVKRNSQTILNTAFNGIDEYNRYDPAEAPMFWDIRAQSLEAQALEPIKAFEEMRGTNFEENEIVEVVVDRLKTIPAYQQLFSQAFAQKEAITADNLAKAIAAFERTLVTNNARFDQYMRGDATAISLSELEGFELFKKTGCINCHNGPAFSDWKIHVLGTPDNDKLPTRDLGFEEQLGFRTPTLRNLRYTAPYMHNGVFPDLLKVLEFYEDIAGHKQRNPDIAVNQLDPLVFDIRLNARDMRSIISFLNTLNDDDFDKVIPEAVPSGLAVGGNIGL